MTVHETPASIVSPAILDLDGFERVSATWERFLDVDHARSVVMQFPERSVWVESARECAIVADWRRRPEVASIVGMHAIRHRRELMARAAVQAEALGLDAIVTIEWNETLRPEVYESAGFELFDAVMPFELERRHFPEGAESAHTIKRLDVQDVAILDQLIAVDHAAFNWLWINSRAEFVHYGRSPEVELWGVFAGQELIGYTGITQFGHWGHIDRLAVHPEWQSRGAGNALTRFAINRLAGHGCATVGLSTQVDNWRSQRLYSKLGFRRADGSTYRIYGRRFDHP